MQDFRKIDAWERAQVLTVELYHATVGFTVADAGLRSQIRDAAISIGANLAEGSRSGTPAQFARYLQYSIASCSEIESHLDLANRLGLIGKARVDALSDEAVQIRKMIVGYRRRVVARKR